MSNYSDNAKAIDQFRKELRAMLEDISEIDKNVLNQAMNEGVAFAKRHTPVVSGFLRKSWHKLRTKKSAAGVEAELVNSAEYASYWNDGHRIVNKKGGITKGFVKGTYVLEKTGDYIEKRMIVLFDKAVKEVQKEHDK